MTTPNFVMLGASLAFAPTWVQDRIQRLADFEQRMAQLQVILNANADDMERVRNILYPEVDTYWIESPGAWATHAACQGRTVEELIAMANRVNGND